MPDSPPKLAVIVANGITGDSRVQKVAIAAARDGWDVTLIGLGTGKKVETSTMGPVTVLRVPVRDHYRRYRKPRDGQHLRRRVTQAGLPDRGALTGYGAAHGAWLLRQETRLATLSGPGVLLKPVQRGWVGTRHAVFRFRRRLWGWEQFRIPQQVPPSGDWRRDWPSQVDIDLALVPVLVNLAPDVIHANDITTLTTAGQAVAKLRRNGHRVGWLYDAHEYVRGVDWPRPAQEIAFRAMENEFIRRADAVVTVSPEIADLLRRDYALAETPLVVRNTPVRQAIGVDKVRPSVRAAAGVADDVPLLVYSGWIAAERGLSTAVEALAELPECRLAIVANQNNPELRGLLDQAVKAGVRDRVHVVPYVAQHQVPDYLSTADLGLICSKRTLNYEMSLPTKLSEYLHGGVPVVASDVRTLRAFVEEHGVGQVFRSEDPQSLAAAVRRGLADRDGMARKITEDILRELSWEEQSTGLVALYRRIAPRTPESPRTPEVERDVPWTIGNRMSVAPTVSAEIDRTWRPLGETTIRLGLGPANYAGQAARFAAAVTRARRDVSAEVFMYRSARPFGFPADVYHEVAKLGAADVQLDQVRRIVGRYTHLVADAFRPVFGHLNGDHVGADLPMLRSAGIKVALLSHGSDIRQPLRHLDRHEYSHFRDAPEGLVEALLAITDQNLRTARESELPMYVTTPDLLDDAPWAIWAPLVVDVDAWRCDKPVMERRRPVVLHAPSTRWTKGTDRIMPVLEDLRERGVIELRLAEGVAWAEMRDMVQDADVVIDQFTTGAYGTLSCEAMAAGRPVVAYISEQVKEVVGPDLPIVSATPATLREALESLFDDRDRAAKVGAASADFAEKYHGGEWTARVLGDFLA